MVLICAHPKNTFRVDAMDVLVAGGGAAGDVSTPASAMTKWMRECEMSKRATQYGCPKITIGSVPT